MNRTLFLLAICLMLLSRAAHAKTWAVLDFESHTDDEALAVLGPAVADMLRTDLVRSGEVTIVERDRLAAVLAELELQKSDAFDPQAAVSIGKLVGAESIVLGAVHASAGTLRLDARVVDVDTGVATEAKSVEGPASELFDLEHTLAVHLIGEVPDWTPLAAEEMTQGVDLFGLFGRIWTDAAAVPAAKVERRPATPGAPPTKKVCRDVELAVDPIENTTRKTGRAPLMRVVQGPEGTVLTLRLPSLLGMRPNPAISDPAVYGGGSVQVQLLLADGTLITLHSHGAPIASTEVGGGLEFTFDIDRPVLEALASSGPTLVRWKLSKGDTDLEVTPRDAERRWQPVFACLLRD